MRAYLDIVIDHSIRADDASISHVDLGRKAHWAGHRPNSARGLTDIRRWKDLHVISDSDAVPDNYERVYNDVISNYRSAANDRVLMYYDVIAYLISLNNCKRIKHRVHILFAASEEEYFSSVKGAPGDPPTHATKPRRRRLLQRRRYRRRIGLFEKEPGGADAISARQPDVGAGAGASFSLRQRVQYMVVIQPLRLIVNVALFTERRFLICLQIQNVQAPNDSTIHYESLLVGDARG